MMTRFRSLFLIGPLLAATSLLAACSTNPATGESNFSIVSEAQEREIGADAHPQVIEQFGVYEEFPALNGYVAGIALRLHSVSEMADDPFTFTLLDSDMVNAFAIPGGYVYVTRGLMALANNEAELAGVIGHEIGHVTARHGAQRMTQQTLAQIGVLAVGIALQDQNLMQLANVGAMAWLAG
jgi:predicted Zn-dependent protease